MAQKIEIPLYYGFLRQAKIFYLTHQFFSLSAPISFPDHERVVQTKQQKYRQFVRCTRFNIFYGMHVSRSIFTKNLDKASFEDKLLLLAVE